MVFTVYDKSYEEIPGITFSLSRENEKKLYALQIFTVMMQNT